MENEQVVEQDFSNQKKDAIKQPKDIETSEDSEGEEGTVWYEFLPLAIFLTVLLAIIIYMIVDWSSCVRYFEELTVYIREHPNEAIAIIIFV